jgi:hypothetical protein
MLTRAVRAVAVVALFAAAGVSVRTSSKLPDRLEGPAFWRLSQELSEAGGMFPSENLVSNEEAFPDVLDSLAARVPAGTAHIGVGPEQNFSYIAETHPGIVFIVDVRRGNLQLQLLYKAIFELSTTRAEFVSRLFGRTVPRKLGNDATAAAIFGAIEDVGSTSDRLAAEFRAVSVRLVDADHLPIPAEDLTAIRALLSAFHDFGPQISYSPGDFGWPTFSSLMRRTDGRRERSFLSSEASYRTVRDLERRHLVVPVVGNLAGSKTLEAIGHYLRDHDATVGAMYVSNVEHYLILDHSWRAFCSNVRALPLTDRSTFIRSSAVRPFGGLIPTLGSMQDQTLSCASALSTGGHRW